MATIADIMAGLTPKPNATGVTTADDMVFAVNFKAASSEGEYLVADDGVTEATGSLEAQAQDTTYLRRGQVTTKTGTNRTFTVSGERIKGDAFQDAALAHEVKFGTGSAVVFDYVYFDGLTGVGEKGTVSVQIEDDFAGAAGEMAQFSATFTSTEKPEKYTYTVTP